MSVVFIITFGVLFGFAITDFALYKMQREDRYDILTVLALQLTFAVLVCVIFMGGLVDIIGPFIWLSLALTYHQKSYLPIAHQSKDTPKMVRFAIAFICLSVAYVLLAV